MTNDCINRTYGNTTEECGVEDWVMEYFGQLLWEELRVPHRDRDALVSVTAALYCVTLTAALLCATHSRLS